MKVGSYSMICSLEYNISLDSRVGSDRISGKYYFPFPGRKYPSKQKIAPDNRIIIYWSPTPLYSTYSPRK